MSASVVRVVSYLNTPLVLSPIPVVIEKTAGRESIYDVEDGAHSRHVEHDVVSRPTKERFLDGAEID